VFCCSEPCAFAPGSSRNCAGASETFAVVSWVRFLKALWGRTEGASLTEYGFLLGLLAIVVLASLTLMGQTISSLFSKLASFAEGVSK
jgi:Flp pilus assembly pilin Flp